jgi:lysine 2,3-aminomutase
MIYNEIQKEIENRIGKTGELSRWKDWKWQLKNAICNLETFEHLSGIQFKPKEKKALEETFKLFPLSITPYYLSLIDQNNYRNDPVFKQAFGGIEELIVSASEMADPLSEDKDSPVEGITHRYPDRVLFHVSNRCAMYCRHCTRKRKVGDVDYVPSTSQLLKGVEYIRNHPQVRDVLLSGGDPLMLSDDKLDWLLSELSSISHLEIIRIGTRIPVVLPYRVTDKLISVLKKHQPLWINTHFNHPNEITSSSKEALARLADAGFPLGNQSVLLAGVNDCPRIMRALLHKLVQNRVRPYYLYQCDLSEGCLILEHPLAKALK